MICDTSTYVRWMIRADMPAVQELESWAFEFPWTEVDFIRCLRQRNCIGMVAEQDDQFAGFMIYELHQSRLHLLSLAVNKEFQRRGVGTAMVKKLTGKLSHDHRNRITLEVRETNLAAQLFFKHTGFRAVKVLRDFYEDSKEIAYAMRYLHAGDATSRLENND